MKLQGMTALITGGNSGIGLATARLFIQEGANVVLTGRDEKTLDAAAAELGPKSLAIQADALDPQAIRDAVETGVGKFGKIDIVFANAGIGGMTPVGATEVDAFDKILRTNVSGVFFTVQAAAPHLNEGASIVLNGSIVAEMGMPGWSAYAAAKAGVRAMTRVLAAEFAPKGIRVNQVTPGAARTSIWERNVPKDMMSAVEESIIRTIPLGRFGEAKEVARTVLFLASKDSSNVVATEIVVDGGAIGAPHGAPIYRQ